ncbi:MAG: T9SS type A sorting domain-containing protein [Bacteroidota bacterium]
MRKALLLFILAIVFFCSETQALWTNKTMMFGGISRSYRVYQSVNYNASVPASLIIALHGLGDDMNNFSGIGLNYIADTANIICIFPQAIVDPLLGSSAWNSGAGYMGYTLNAGINDIGFINALIDTAIAKYAIDIHRVYLCGFSMGGFMTERMALQSNTRIAAFGSMSGTIGNMLTNLNPGRHVPIIHFHGTSDSTVYYSGNLYGMDAEALISFWVGNNACDTTPVTFSFPNTANDSITVERYQYSSGTLESEVWFYKMIGASHTLLFQPTNDITEVMEMWQFFRRHTLATAGIPVQANPETDVQIYPNPASTFVNVNLPEGSNEHFTLDIYNVQGVKVSSEQMTGTSNIINVSDQGFASGMYFFRISGNGMNCAQKVLIKK